MNNTVKKLAPIILFVYARLEHTKKTIEALERNLLAKDSHLIIYSDGAKSKKEIEQVKAVRQYIASLTGKKKFKIIEIIETEQNKGLAKSIIDGVTISINKYKSVIVLEDDLVTAPDFLNFMNDALIYYKNKPEIGAISGYSPIKQENFPAYYEEDVYVTNRNCSIGWATWENIWNRVDWNVQGYKLFKQDYKARMKFDECGYDRSTRLDRQVKYNLNSWSIRFGYSLFRMDTNVIYPTISRLKHIGWDGTGTHSKGVSDNTFLKFNNKIPEQPQSYRLSNPSKDKNIVIAMREVYSGRFLTKLKRIVYNIYFALGF